MIRERQCWLDVAKGITIILMVLGHSSIPEALSNFIWAFHMPLFFIASGWTSNWDKYNISSFIVHKLRTLMLPFLIYSLIVLFLLDRDVVYLLKNGWEGYALWFIPVLFFSLLVGKLFMTLKSETKQWGGVLILLCVGGALSYYKIRFPWTLSSVPYATFFILLGSKTKFIQKYVSNPSIWILLLLVAITGIISYYYRLDMAWNNITPIVPKTIGAVSGTLMIFMISVFIEKYATRCSFVLQRIGKETYIVLAFSQVIITLLNMYFSLNAIVKYVLLLILLVILKYAKDGINYIAKTKIL